MDGILGVLGVMVVKILRKKQQIYSEYYKATRKKIKIGDSLCLWLTGIILISLVC